jgi:17beta-estradiol 17-dehydrogenase / very-long-chain 3-oxoacyl-CoA reductase
MSICTTQALAIIGALFTLRAARDLFSGFYAFFLRPAQDLTKFGKWAIITGATDGIGKAMAIEMARKGMNVVLMSRTQQRLDDTKRIIQEESPNVEVRTLQVDFNQINDPQVRKSIQNLLEDIKDVGVLVNNVGVSYEYPDVSDFFLSSNVLYIKEVGDNNLLFL